LLKSFFQNKKMLSILCVSLLLCGCTNNSADIPATADANPSTAEPSATTATSKVEEFDYGEYLETGGEVALVTGGGLVMDNGFNQSALEGIKSYSNAAGVSYSYYGAAEETAAAYEQVVIHAIENNATLVVCAGFHFEQVIGSLQNKYPHISFLLIDSVPKDAEGNTVPIAENVFCITYHEEESGYLAGYMCVLDGFRHFGFIGGEQLDSVERFGYGYLQGIEAAAKALSVTDDISVEYWYAGTFLPSEEIEEKSMEWYKNGTEIIFACGGSLYQSVLASAEKCDGMLIGVDVDQSSLSPRFITSAVKGIQPSIVSALDEYYASGKKWSAQMGGTFISYGSSNKGIQLPISKSAWRFENVTFEEYFQVFDRMHAGKLLVSDDLSMPPETTFAVNYHNPLILSQ